MPESVMRPAHHLSLSSLLALWSLLVLFSSAARAQVQLPGYFSRHCVLQRDVPVPVWGRADPGEEVTVRFAGQSVTTAADRFGRFRGELEAMPASSEGRPLIVEGSGRTIQVDDVYVGDVWLDLTPCWYVGEEPKLAARDPDAAGLPPICVSRPASVHEFQNHSARPLEEYGPRSGSRWSRYSAGSKYFASDAFYLGVGLASRTQAPVGVVGLGISTLESMTPPEGYLLAGDDLGPLADTVARWVPSTRRGRTAYLQTLSEIRVWVKETRPLLERGGVSHDELNQPPRLPGPPVNERGPTTFYNHVIHRFARAAIRGIIIRPATYNVGDPAYHARARALILGLREVFGRKDLPVAFVQMHSPTRYEHREAGSPSDWIALRREQGRLRGVPLTTVIPAYDLDDRDTLDPDIGRRVAAWAAWLTTGAGQPTGPTYRSHRVDGSRVIVEFDHAQEGLMVGAMTPGRPMRAAPEVLLGGFQLAGSDGEWRDAAAIIDGERVVVTSDRVKAPLAVRYAWAPEPAAANLYNRAGFPALPFEM